MIRKLLHAAVAVSFLVAFSVFGLSAVWPVVSVVETGMTPEYADLKPRYYSTDARRVFDETVAAIEQDPAWTLANSDVNTRTLSASRDGWLDSDVEVRIDDATEFVVRVHVRSETHFGAGDLGENARTIEELFDRIDARLGAVRLDRGTPDSAAGAGSDT
jgi:uncharacterized protein (DUF1499 family)